MGGWDAITILNFNVVLRDGLLKQRQGLEKVYGVWGPGAF